MTKSDLKEALGADTSNLAAKSDLVSLKAEVDKISIDKFKTISADLSKLSNVVDNDVVKKTLCNKLVTQVNTIDTNIFVLKTQYSTDKSGIEKKVDDVDKKMPDTTILAKIY